MRRDAAFNPLPLFYQSHLSSSFSYILIFINIPRSKSKYWNIERNENSTTTRIRMNYTRIRGKEPVVYCPCKSRRLFAGGSNSPATDLLIVLKLLVRRIIELKLLRVEMTKVDACNRGVRTCAANENEIPSRRLLSSRGETTLLREGAALSAATVRSYSLFPAILPTPIFSTLV